MPAPRGAILSLLATANATAFWTSAGEVTTTTAAGLDPLYSELNTCLPVAKFASDGSSTLPLIEDASVLQPPAGSARTFVVPNSAEVASAPAAPRRKA